MTGPSFHVSSVPEPDSAGLRLVGALDMDTAGQLRAALDDCFARRCDRVVLDLRDLRFCDCAGLNLLLEARVAADRIGSELCVRGAREQVARLFALTGADGLFADHVTRLPPRTA